MTGQSPNFYGNAVTPKLTKEQEQRVIELLAQGKSQTAITQELGISIGRVRQVRAKRQAAEAQAILQATKNTPFALETLQESMTKVVELLAGLTVELTLLKTEHRKMNKALYRRQTENKRLRETVAEQKAALRELKRFYHGKTGREWM